MIRRWLLLIFLALAAGLVVLGFHYWPERHLRAARNALERRDYPSVRAALPQHLEARPNSAEAHLMLARLDRRSNKFGDAGDHLDSCQSLHGPADAIELEQDSGESKG